MAAILFQPQCLNKDTTIACSIVHTMWYKSYMALLLNNQHEGYKAVKLNEATVQKAPFLSEHDVVIVQGS